MDLWIRSQDKELLKKINNIEIDYLDFKKYNYAKDIESKGEYSIRGNGETLGQYKTKERALEVLDEIEEKISLINTINLVKDRDSLISFGNAIPEEKISGLSYPYQMPKE